jgi:hypothetical protein
MVAADRAAPIGLLEHLPTPEPFAPITLELYHVNGRGFSVFGWRVGARRPSAAEEMDDLADELSLQFGTAVAVQHDDQVGVRAATLSRDGEPERYFGEADEVWVSYGASGERRTDGPRYPGNAVPKDVECDCIRNDIDAALEAAGFADWVTARKLATEVARADNPEWRRAGRES